MFSNCIDIWLLTYYSELKPKSIPNHSLAHLFYFLADKGENSYGHIFLRTRETNVRSWLQNLIQIVFKLFKSIYTC